jgi:hypothetical protein
MNRLLSVGQFCDILTIHGYNKHYDPDYNWDAYCNETTNNIIMMYEVKGYVTKICDGDESSTIIHPTIDCLMLFIRCGKITADNLCIIGMEVLPYTPLPPPYTLNHSVIILIIHEIYGAVVRFGGIRPNVKTTRYYIS